HWRRRSDVRRALPTQHEGCEMSSYDALTLWARSNDGEFSESDLGLVLAALPPVGKDGPWLGGGALRRALSGTPQTSDFDFFFRDADQLEAFAAKLAEIGLTKVRETAHYVQFNGYLSSATRQVEVQCIRFRYYENPAQVVASSDSTICQFRCAGEQ